MPLLANALLLNLVRQFQKDMKQYLKLSEYCGMICSQIYGVEF